MCLLAGSCVPASVLYYCTSLFQDLHGAKFAIVAVHDITEGTLQ